MQKSAKHVLRPPGREVSFVRPANSCHERQLVVTSSSTLATEGLLWVYLPSYAW